MSAEIGTYKRVVTVTIEAFPAGSPAPVGGTKIATDAETGLDIYVVAASLKWVKV